LRGFGNSQTYYYLQTLLTGDTETGRKSRTFFMAEPLWVMARKFQKPKLQILKMLLSFSVDNYTRHDKVVSSG
jgi:hypothetical protein